MAELIWQCAQRTTTPNPNSKILKNLCSYICADSDETPHVTNATRFSGAIFLYNTRLTEFFVSLESGEIPATVNDEYNCTVLKGIYTWQKTNSVKPKINVVHFRLI
jgi:hypothetical protein